MPTRRFPDLFTDCLMYLNSSRVLKRLDKRTASVLMTCLLFYAGAITFHHINLIARARWGTGRIYAVDICRLVGDLAWSSLMFLLWLLYNTLCFKEPGVRRLWEAAPTPIGAISRGGFVPRPAAALISVLMVLSSTLVSSTMLSADELLKKGFYGPHLWRYDSCVADAIEADTRHYGVPHGWFQRFSRKTAVGCFGSNSSTRLPHLLDTLGVFFRGAAMDSFTAWENLTVEEKNALGDNLTAAKEKNASLIKGLRHPIIDGVEDTSRHCIYFCADFKPVSLVDFINNFGSTLTGAAFITWLTDKVTLLCAWHVVDSTTSADELAHAILGQRLPVPLPPRDGFRQAIRALGLKHRQHPGSQLMVVIQLLAIYLVSSFIADHIAADGYFTVDHTASLFLLCSVMAAMLQRLWSPYTLRSITYTHDLWANGHDTFWRHDETTGRYSKHELSLYDWIHMENSERSEMLLHYCRAITSAELELYDRKGFIPERWEEKEEQEQEPHVSGGDKSLTTMAFNCCVTVLHPWMICCPPPRDGEKKKMMVVTIRELTLDHKRQTETSRYQWTETHQPGYQWTETHQHVVIDQGAVGTILSLGKEDGTVVVEFCDNCQDRRDSSKPMIRDKFTSEELQERTFPVPLQHLEEWTEEWSFVRKVLRARRLFVSPLSGDLPSVAQP